MFMTPAPAIAAAFAVPIANPADSNVIAFPVPVREGTLRRPATLVRAARAGLTGWRRDRDLPRLLRAPAPPRPGFALPWLRDDEDRLNDARLNGDASYDMHRHVLVLIAILAEAAHATNPAAGRSQTRTDLLAVSGL